MIKLSYFGGKIPASTIHTYIGVKFLCLIKRDIPNCVNQFVGA